MTSFRFRAGISKILPARLRKPFVGSAPTESTLSATSSDGKQSRKANLSSLSQAKDKSDTPDATRKRFRPNSGRMWSIRLGGTAMADMQRTNQIKRGKCNGTDLLSRQELADEHAKWEAKNSGKKLPISPEQALLLSQTALSAVDSMVGPVPPEKTKETSSGLVQTAVARGLKLSGQGTGLGLPQTLSRSVNHRLAVTGEFRPSKTKQLADQLTHAVKAAPSAPPLGVVPSLAEIRELRSQRRQVAKDRKNLKEAIELNANTLVLLEETAAAHQPQFESFMSEVSSSSSSSLDLLEDTAVPQPQPQPRSESFMSDVSTCSDAGSTVSAPKSLPPTRLSVINAIAQHKRKQTELRVRLASVEQELENIQMDIVLKLRGRIHDLLTLDDKGQPLDSQMQQLLLQAHAQLAAAPCGAKDLPTDLALEMVSYALKMARSAQAASVPYAPKASPYIECDIARPQQAHCDDHIKPDQPKPAAASDLFSDLQHVTKAGASVDLAAKIFSLPRGTELIERLVPDLIPRCIRDNLDLRNRYRMALRVKVSASDALSRLPADDVASRAWLQRARKVAQHELDLAPPFAQKFTPADFAAFHGVRNGFTRIGPGTAHACALARVQKMQPWISRSNSWGRGRKHKSPFIAKTIRLAGMSMQNLGLLPTRTEAHMAALASARALNRSFRKLVRKYGSNPPQLARVDPQVMALLDGLLTAIKTKAAAPRRRDLLKSPQGEPDAETVASRAALLRVDAKLLDYACAVAEARHPKLNLKTSALLTDLKKSPGNLAQTLRTVLSRLAPPEPEPELDPLAGASHYPPVAPPPKTNSWRFLLKASQAQVQKAVVSRLWEHKGKLDDHAVADMFSELTMDLQDRTKLRMTQGGSVGLSTQSTTIALKGLIRAMSLLSLGLKFDLKKTYASEALLELGQPLHATQLLLGEQKTHTTVARAGARVGTKLKLPFTRLEMNARADIVDHRRTHEKQEIGGVFLRAKRNSLVDKDRPRRILAQQIRALCLWKEPTLEQAKNGECSNVLDHILSKYPDFSLSAIESNRKETHKRDVNVEGTLGPQWGDRLKLNVGAGVASGNQRWEHRIKEVDAGVLQVLETRSNVRTVRSVQAGAGLTGTSLNHALQNTGGTSLAMIQSLLRVDAEMEFNPREFEEIFKFTTDQHTILPIQVQSNTESRHFPDFTRIVNKERAHWVRLRSAQHPGGVTSPYNWIYAQNDLDLWMRKRKDLHGDDTIQLKINGLAESAAPEVDIQHARIIVAKAYDDVQSVQVAQDGFLALMQTDILEARRLMPKTGHIVETKFGIPLNAAAGQATIRTSFTPNTFPTWG
jgi:hypothetical protein